LQLKPGFDLAKVHRFLPVGDERSELEQAIAQAQTLADQQTEGKFAKASGNMPVSTLLAQCKNWIADLLTAADNAFEEEPDMADKYHQGGKIGRSVPKTLGRMEALLVVAQTHKPQLAAWGFGDPEFAAGNKLIGELTSTNTTQDPRAACSQRAHLSAVEAVEPHCPRGVPQRPDHSCQAEPRCARPQRPAAHR